MTCCPWQAGESSFVDACDSCKRGYGSDDKPCATFTPSPVLPHICLPCGHYDDEHV